MIVIGITGLCEQRFLCENEIIEIPIFVDEVDNFIFFLQNFISQSWIKRVQVCDCAYAVFQLLHVNYGFKKNGA